LQRQKKFVVEKRTNVPSFATLKGKLCKQEKNLIFPSNTNIV
jgi:hypothetical protein